MDKSLVVDLNFYEVQPTPAIPLWRMKPSTNPRDAAADAARRLGQKKHGFPDILPIGQGEGKRVDLTREWQLYLMAINPQMTARDVSAILNYQVAFTNGTGFGKPDTPYQNWILNQDTKPSNPLPQFDKVRTCAYACHTGVIVGDQLKLTTLDGNNPPPKIADVNPKSHPHLFFHATIVWMDVNNNELARVPFEQRAVAPEWGYAFEVTIMPLVSCYDIFMPLDEVERVSAYSLPYYKYP
jgi:hypothetical protein